MAQNLKFVLGRVENIVGKGENAGYAFTSFPTLFSEAFLFWVVKSRLCGKELSQDSNLLPNTYVFRISRTIFFLNKIYNKQQNFRQVQIQTIYR